MVRAFVGLGSNLNEPVMQISRALEELAQIPQSEFIATSSLYRSEPLGDSDQPDYINAVVALDTELSAIALLDHLQRIEDAHQRQRGEERWIARTLDLDILLYGNQVIDSERLVIPHYHMQQRNFVLVPLLEIAPELELPDGTTVTKMPLATDMNGLTKLD